MLANHGPVVAGKDVEAACYAIEDWKTPRGWRC